MNIFRVGGCVRDQLLGHPVHDIDYVVVGATPQAMLDKGFLQVGADFPVFLHPETKDEYALARTERKVSKGHLGFAVHIDKVTLEEDLSRRDLTINAMAMDAQGNLVDPYNGLADLENKVFRHVSPAFCEDPLRVLRVLRFRARYGSEWQYAPETWKLMQDMVDGNQLQELSQERIFKEIQKGLMEAHPELMLDGMARLGLAGKKGFESYAQLPLRNDTALARAVQNNAGIEVRFVLAFGMDLMREDNFVSQIPNSVQTLQSRFKRMARSGKLFVGTLGARELRHLGECAGALKQGESFTQVLELLNALGSHRGAILAQVAETLKRLDNKAIVEQRDPGSAPFDAIRAAQLQALHALVA